MAGAGKRAGQGSKTTLPGLGMARVSELPGDCVSPMEGKLPAGGRGATVRGDGVSHSGQGLRGCHVRTARNCTTRACQGWCAAEGFVWSLPSAHKHAPREGSIWVPPWGEPNDRIMGRLVQYEMCAFLPSLLPDSSAPGKEDSETAKERS